MAQSTRKRISDLEQRVTRLEEIVDRLFDEPEPALEEAVEQGGGADSEPEPEPEPVSDLSGQSALYAAYGDVVADLLVDAGYLSVEAVQNASDDELRAIEGIGPGRLQKIREAK